MKMANFVLSMKPDRSYFFIGISSFALVIVLLIQVDWIFEAAQVKEELFNEKAMLVLSKTADVLASDTVIYRSMGLCMSVDDVHKIDSVFNHYMKIYNIRIGYFFEVNPDKIRNPASTVTPYKPGANQSGCYQTCLPANSSGNRKNMLSRNGMLLKLVFPDKDQYIVEEMSGPFVTSVILIVIVLILSWRTILSLMKEKKISEHTREFLNNMTHEFKTPLTNIGLAGKMMTRESNITQSEKIKHYSGIILEENEKLRLQVEQVLSMTALERDEIPLRKTESILCTSSTLMQRPMER